jgi:hypothetical protein
VFVLAQPSTRTVVGFLLRIHGAQHHGVSGRDPH